MLQRNLIGAASVFALLGLNSPASAQAAESDQAVEEVVVTGSRIMRTGADAPTPVTVASTEQLQLAAPLQLADGLNQLPQFRGSNNPRSGGLNAGVASVGANLLNLRNLGTQRTLILLDGRRTVPTTTIGSVDTATLPETLVQRVEVVTGGASAAYGSDAVAGVVNFVLDTKFSGFKGEVSGGISTYGDADSQKASLSFGKSFAGERGHFIASASHYRVDGIGPLDLHRRKWSERDAGILPNVPGTAIPNRLIFSDGVTSSQFNFGGLITTPGPLRDITFGPGGEILRFQPGDYRGGALMHGGVSDRHDTNLAAAGERTNLFAHVTYDISDAFRVFAEGSYADIRSNWNQYYNGTTSAANQFTIFSGNPFLPAEIQATMTANNIASFRLGRLFSEGEMIGAINRGHMARGALGFRGSIGDRFEYDASYSRGEFRTKVTNTNVMNFNKVYAAADAVRDPASGEIVCRSTLLFGLHPGCVPLNVFGAGSPSAEAIAYFQDDEFRVVYITQDVLAANLRGSLFALTADAPVRFAVGGEYRKEQNKQTTSANTQEIINFTNVRGGPASLVGQRGPFIIGNFQPVQGAISVKEAYAEVEAPLLRDRPLGKSLDLNLAGRITDYSTSGRVETWKATVNYAPFADLRLRATRSRDIRAANATELFAGGLNGGGTVRDAAGVSFQFISRTVGNPELRPEKADTLTLGAVYRPSWLPGADFAIDYYDIKIDGAIASLTPQLTVDECNRGSTVACDNFVIQGGIYRIQLPQLNLSRLATSGIDFEAGYRTEFAGGSLAFRALLNYSGKYETTTPGAATIDRAGEVGGLTSNNPKWLGNFNLSYTRGPLTVFLQERYIDNGKFDATFVEGIDINDNSIPAVFYTDVTVKYAFEVRGGQFEAFGTVNNLFNKAPPLVPLAVGTLQRNSNFALYDVLGRYFTMGLRFRY